MDEDILTAILGGDEAEALVAEEFNRAVVRHVGSRTNNAMPIGSIGAGGSSKRM